MAKLVLLDRDSHAYFSLDRVGGRMWEVLASSPSVDAAVEQLLSEYDVDANTLRQDLDVLIRQLVGSGLAELHES